MSNGQEVGSLLQQVERHLTNERKIYQKRCRGDRLTVLINYIRFNNYLSGLKS